MHPYPNIIFLNLNLRNRTPLMSSISTIVISRVNYNNKFRFKFRIINFIFFILINFIYARRTIDRLSAVSGERRSLIGRPGAAWAYETSGDWLSAVDREYKRPNATVMSSIGLGGLGRQTDRPKLIEDNSQPNSFPVTVSLSSFHSPQFHSFQSFFCLLLAP